MASARPSVRAAAKRLTCKSQVFYEQGKPGKMIHIRGKRPMSIVWILISSFQLLHSLKINKQMKKKC